LAPQQQQHNQMSNQPHPQATQQLPQQQQLQQQHQQIMMHQNQQMFPMYQLPQSLENVSLEQLWRGFDAQTGGMVPMWLSDQALGDQSLGQFGMESYMIPVQYDATQNAQVMHW
jgi:hypothetical protein